MRFSKDHTRVIISVFAVVIMVAACAYIAHTYFTLPQSATSAEPYFLSKSNTLLQVDTNGSIHVTEQRTYVINEDCDRLTWDLDNMGEKTDFTMQSARLTLLDGEGQTTEALELSRAPFNPTWRTTQATPNYHAYAVDTDQHCFYLFYPLSTGQVTVSIDYTLDEAVTAYRDVTEVNWSVAPGTSTVTTQEAITTVLLPTPADADQVQQNVFAWSHGPETSSVEVSEDGVITHAVSNVQVWQYSDLRICFPTSWMTNLSPRFASQHSSQLHLSTAQTEEAAWVDAWHLRSINNYTFDAYCLVACLIVLLFSVCMYVRHGRVRLPQFRGEYWTQPVFCDRALHPSTVGQIWRWNRKNPLDLHAALNYLVVKGAVSATRKEEGIVLSRANLQEDQLKPIDQATLSFLFDQVAQGETSLSAAQLENCKNNQAQAYSQAVMDWCNTLNDQFDQDAYLEPGGRTWQVRLLLLALVTAAAGLGLFFFLGHAVVLVGCLATAAMVAVLANYVPRRTPVGNEIVAKAKALRTWIKSESADAPAVDAAQLAALMPYACLFNLKAEGLRKAHALLSEQSGLTAEDLAPLNSAETAGDQDALWQCCYAVELLKRNA
ncbi:MAG: DUF2207 domain-containing protein [Coriobacteriia bacterium]|nr:DUF2207 domain-containing protein [Coriobacteriia bacterium]